MSIYFSPLLSAAAQIQSAPSTNPVYKGSAGQSTVYLAASAVSSMYKGARSLFREIILLGERLFSGGRQLWLRQSH